jgi:class 3 adenylate cyclase
MYQQTRSFYRKTRVILALIGILPFLLVSYLFITKNIDLTETVIIFSALILFSILSGFTLLRNTADQLVGLTKITKKALNGNHSGPIWIDADQELKDIAAHFNALFEQNQEVSKKIKEQSVQLMVYARDLSESYQRLKEEKEIRTKLERYVGENLVEKLVGSKDDVLFENERKEVTILFADIRSFTKISEDMATESVVSMLNQFFEAMSNLVFANNGILDKFMGDQIMAVFGAIPSQNSSAFDAVKAAVEMQEATKMIMKKRTRMKRKTFQIGIGVNTGISILGNVGAKNRMDYTVIGDSVNIASRFQQLAKGGEIIIGEKTYKEIRGGFNVTMRGKARIKNKIEPVICYKI